MKWTTEQLMVARSLLKQGCPNDLLHIILLRCSANDQDWTGLQNNGFVEQDNAGRWWLSQAGKREYSKQKVGRYF